jgi:hypothetical protein
MKLPLSVVKHVSRSASAPKVAAPDAPSHAPPVAGPTVRPSAAQLLSATGGVPLPAPVLQRMQRAFGTGFGRVRVHRGAQAEAFDAAAFTTGERIFLPRHGPSLTSAEGQALLGHELTHVLQQRSGRVRAKGGGVSIDPHPHLEAEAEAAGHAVARGEAPTLSAHPRGQDPGAQPSGVVQRLREDDEGIEMQPLRARGGAAESDAEAEKPEPEKPTPEKPQAATSELEKPEGAAAAKPEEQKAEKPSLAMRGLKAVVGLFANSGKGSGQATAQQADQQVAQSLAGGSELAKQAEASGAAYPPAPDPSVDWAQPQPAGDPASPPPLPIPQPLQGESPASIQPDPPLSPASIQQGPESRKFGHAKKVAAKQARKDQRREAREEAEDQAEQEAAAKEKAAGKEKSAAKDKAAA